MREPPEVALAQRLLRWIARRQLAEFTLRDAHQNHRKAVVHPEDLFPALAVLEGRAYIRRKVASPRIGSGRPPSPAWVVNPLWGYSEITEVLVAGDSEYFEYSEAPAAPGPGTMGASAADDEIVL